MIQRAMVTIGVLVCAWQSLPAAAACPGDCNGDREVTVNELILGVNIVLGSGTLGQCPSLDTGGDGEVTINELIAAVNSALNGCTTGTVAGDYAASVAFDATHSGILNLSARADGQVSGSLLVASRSAAARFAPHFGFAFPIGGVSVALSGTYDPVSGGFEVEGSFVDANGQTVSVVISGELPGPTGTAAINVYIGNDPPFATTLAAGMLPTPTVTPGPTPTPGPAGSQRIVFAGSISEPHIFVINVDGSGKTQLTTSTGIDSGPAWSPDGTKIAFATPDAENRNVGIAVINADGSGFHRLAADSAVLDGVPAWSPDGSQIACTAGGGDAIDVMNGDGSNRHRLVTKLAGDKYGHMSWSPDGTKIAFESTRGKASNHDTDFEIFVMNRDGSGLAQLTDNALPDHHPDWSPDGQRIVFARTNTPTGGILTIKPDGSAEARVVFDPFGGTAPSWSRDGLQLAYSSPLGIKITDATGGNVLTVPNTSFLGDFDFK